PMTQPSQVSGSPGKPGRFNAAPWVGRVSALELGRIAALEGRADEALQRLEDAIARGQDRSLLVGDPDLRSLREDPDLRVRFAKLAGDQNR
ncbi:MAG: hypothetical protein MPN21_25330, partial [Thermoanaerobaculia bacterium]|nr:hypothetical protein [Thermoanaerobaculia bacterium]